MTIVRTPETEEYWSAAQRRELALQYCLACGRHYFYPRPFCPTCHGADVEWRRVSGRATLVSWIVVHRAPPGVTLTAPYVVALVELEEGPRLMTNIMGSDPSGSELIVGQALVVDFDPRDEGPELVPVFAPAVPAA